MIDVSIGDTSFVFNVGPSAGALITTPRQFKLQSKFPVDWTVLVDYPFISAPIGDLIAPCSISALPEGAHPPGATGTTYLDRGQAGVVSLKVPRVGGTYRFFGSLLTIQLAPDTLLPGSAFIVALRGFPKVTYLPYTIPYGPFTAPATPVVIPKFATHYNISPYALGVQVRSHSGSVLQTTVDPLVNSSEWLALPPGAHDIFDAAAVFVSTLVSFRLHG